MRPTPGGRSINARSHVLWFTTWVVLSTFSSSLAAPDTMPSVAARPISPHGGRVMRSSCTRHSSSWSMPPDTEGNSSGSESRCWRCLAAGTPPDC
eukprot:360578-Chlamydomonas_euryale.AAC.17